jgi:hypothetical protein
MLLLLLYFIYPDLSRGICRLPLLGSILYLQCCDCKPLHAQSFCVVRACDVPSAPGPRSGGRALVGCEPLQPTHLAAVLRGQSCRRCSLRHSVHIASVPCRTMRGLAEGFDGRVLLSYFLRQVRDKPRNFVQACALSFTSFRELIIGGTSSNLFPGHHDAGM